MIIFSGGRASGFRNVHDYDSYDVDGTRLFHVRGTSSDDMRAVQVAEVAASLNSADVFVLEVPSQTYIWTGTASSDEEKAMGVEIANLVSPGRHQVAVMEGEEPEDFWNALGGQTPYTSDLAEPVPILEPRLFHCILNSNGKLRVDEIKPFMQEDLVDDDVMVLDSGLEIYVWVGVHSTEKEQEAGFSMAEEYLRTEPSHRAADSTLIFLVRQRNEPENFKDIFPSWDDNMWEV